MPKKSPAKATLPSAPPDISSVTLMKIGSAVAAVRDVSTLLKTIVEELQPVFGFHDVGLFLINEAENYHVDLTVSIPEISPSEGNRQLHNLVGDHREPHRGSPIAWMLKKTEAAQGPVLLDFVNIVHRFPEHAHASTIQAMGYRDCLATSLRVGGELMGMFCVNALRTEAFTHVDRSFFQSVADLIAVAVSNVLANEEVLRQKQRVEQLLTISQAITQIKDRKQLLKTIYQRIKPIFPHNAFGLFVLNENGQYHYELIDAETLNYYPPQVAIEEQYGAHHRYPHPGSPVENMMQQGPGLFMVEDFMDYPQIPIMYEAGLRQMIGGPLTYGGEAIGMLCFNSKQEDFYTEQDLPLFAAIAEQLSVAVSNVLANEEVLNEKAKVERLHFVSEVMTSIQRRDQLTLAFDRIRTVFAFDNAGLFVLTEDGQQHYELLDSQTLDDDPVQQQLEQRFGRYAHFPHPNSPIEEMMQASRIALYDVPELLARYPDYPQSQAIRQAGFRQLIAAPLRQGKEVIGLLNFNSQQADRFGEADVAFMQAVTEQMSTVVSNILSNEREQEQREFKEILLRISKSVAAIQGQADLFRTIVANIKPVFPFDDLGIFVNDESGQHQRDLSVDESFGLVTGTAKGWLPRDSGIDSFIQQGPMITSLEQLMRQHPNHPHYPVLVDQGYKCIIAGPLWQGGGAFGMLCFWSKQPDGYSERDIPLFQAIADQLAVAVANVLANERLLKEKQFKETMLSISEAVASIQDRNDLLKVIFEKVQKAFPSDCPGLFMLDASGDYHIELTDAKAVSQPINVFVHEQVGTNMYLHQGTAVELWMNQSGPVIYNLSQLHQKITHPHFPHMLEAGLQQVIAGPLLHAGQRVGTLCFNSKHAQQYSEKDFPLFQAIADQLAVAVSNVLANEDIQRRERFKTLQVELMRIFEVSYELKKNYQQAGRLLQAEIPYDLFVALRFETDSYQLQGGSYFYADQAGEGHWLRQQPLLEGEVTNEQLLQGWCQDVEEGVHYLNGKDFADCLPPHAPVREAYRQLGVRSGLLGRTVLNANSSLLIACFSYRPEAYGAMHQDLLHRLLPTFRLVTDRSLAYRDVQQLTERLQEENTYLEEEIKLHHNFGEMVGESEALRQAFEQVQQVAATDSTVLILGETGTGKELVARAIHEQSPHREKTLIKINCAALPPQLIESELFGHERGAFTGAVQRRIGKFELAHNSTLFLDEIGELPLELQAKLLRVLQEKVFERLGSNEVLRTDARIVAATNRDLEAEVRQGNFRADLFYRLNVFPIYLPPLRERVGDIPLLAHHFVHRYARKFKKPFVKCVSEGTLRGFNQWSFPGNVRELEHLIERAVILAKQSEITVDLPRSEAISANTGEPGAFKTLRDNERELILRVLEYTQDKVRGEEGAAAILDIKPTTLESRMERLGIQKQTRFV